MGIPSYMMTTSDGSNPDFKDLYLFHGKSAYQAAVERGYKGTEDEWIASLTELRFGTKATFTDTNVRLIYIDLETNNIYRYDDENKKYQAIGGVLGETADTAYRGDRGKIAYEHAISNHAFLPLKGGIMTGDILLDKDIAYSIGSTSKSFLNMYSSQYHIQSNEASYGNLGVDTIGTTETVGSGRLMLGNAKSEGISGNAYGKLFMFGKGAGYTLLTPSNHTDSNILLSLPSDGGTLARVEDNVASANKLETGRKINGTDFNGTKDITTETWGTSRNVYVSDNSGSNTGPATAVDGSKAVTLKLPETIKAHLDGFRVYKTTIPAQQPNIIGWYRIGKTSGFYGSFMLEISGGWNNGAPSVALLSVTIRHNEVLVKQLSGFVNMIDKVRFELIESGSHYIDVHIGYESVGMPEQEFRFWGHCGLEVYSPTIPETTIDESTSSALCVLRNITDTQILTLTGAITGKGTLNGTSLTIDTSVNHEHELVEKANKLQTARTIAISGKATGTATSFDGSDNISIPITAIDPTGITQSASYRLVTDTQINAWNAKPTQAELTTAVSEAVAKILDSSPSTLDTLNELAAALGDDPNFAATMTTELGKKLNTAGGTMTGDIVFAGSNSDRFIKFLATTDATSDVHGWRIGYLGSGAANENYLAFQSGGATGTFANALRFGAETLDAEFGGNILPLTNNSKNIGSSSMKWANVYATTFNGNATSASKLATSRTISLTGTAKGSGTFNGEGDLAINLSANNLSYAHNSHQTDSPGGYIKIKINSTKAWMLSFVVRVYQGYRATDILVSGYNYGSNYWYSPSARILGEAGDNLGSGIEVRFGYDSAWNLWIAIPNGSYTGIDITQVTNGYVQIGDLSGLFTIINESTLSGTVQSTIVAYPPWYRSDSVAASTAATLATARTLTIGNTGKTFNGGSNVAWSLAEIGALPSAGGVLTGSVSLKETCNILLRPSNTSYTSGIGYDTSGNECIALWAKNTVTRLRWHAGVDMSTLTAGKMMGITPDFEISKASGTAIGYIAGNTIIHTGNYTTYCATASHEHITLKSNTDNRAVATTPNDYNGVFKVAGLKQNSTIGSPDSSDYSAIIGIRDWGDPSGGESHEFALTGNGGFYRRHGSTTTWGSWIRMIDTENYKEYCSEKSHTHSYLPLSGGTLTGTVRMNTGAVQLVKYGSSASWINGRDQALVRLDTYNAYAAVTSMKTTNGSFEMGVYTNDTMYFTYTPDANYSTGTNNGYKQVKIDSNGNLSADGTITGNKTYNAVWNDYAEYFERDSLTEKIEPGDIVSWGENGVTKSIINCDEMVVGVCSDSYGHIIGGENPPDDYKGTFEDWNKKKFVPVGLKGRLYVKVIGKVKRGNLIVSSGIPGVGFAIPNEKAYMGIVIGKALENKDTDEEGKVKIMIMLA